MAPVLGPLHSLAVLEVSISGSVVQWAVGGGRGGVWDEALRLGGAGRPRIGRFGYPEVEGSCRHRFGSAASRATRRPDLLVR